MCFFSPTQLLRPANMRKCIMYTKGRAVSVSSPEGKNQRLFINKEHFQRTSTPTEHTLENAISYCCHISQVNLLERLNLCTL